MITFMSLNGACSCRITGKKYFIVEQQTVTKVQLSLSVKIQKTKQKEVLKVSGCSVSVDVLKSDLMFLTRNLMSDIFGENLMRFKVQKEIMDS